MVEVVSRGGVGVGNGVGGRCVVWRGVRGGEWWERGGESCVGQCEGECVVGKHGGALCGAVCGAVCGGKSWKCVVWSSVRGSVWWEDLEVRCVEKCVWQCVRGGLGSALWAALNGTLPRWKTW